MLCEEFMANSGSQLTIHGLFELGSALGHDEIAVLFRNNHFSTIYKRGVCIQVINKDSLIIYHSIQNLVIKEMPLECSFDPLSILSLVEL